MLQKIQMDFRHTFGQSKETSQIVSNNAEQSPNQLKS